MDQNLFARELFGGIAHRYDRWAEFFSLLQYREWHRSLINSVVPRPGEHVLDLCTGTGALALDLAAQGCAVVALDLSRDMLAEAVRRDETARWRGSAPRRRVHFIEGRAEELPFATEAFDVVTFTFLLRYVAAPFEPLGEVARVLRAGGRAAMLEFGVPSIPALRLLWSLYVFVVLPLLTRPVSPGWAKVGAFLGGSISDFYRRYPVPVMIADWERAGFQNIRCRQLSLGGAMMITGDKP